MATPSDLIQKGGSGGGVPCIGHSEISVRSAVQKSSRRNGPNIGRIIASGTCGPATSADTSLRIRYSCVSKRQRTHPRRIEQVLVGILVVTALVIIALGGLYSAWRYH